MHKIAVLLTVFNRCFTTLRGLESLSALITADLTRTYDIFMTDDGSTDGTADAVRKKFPQVHIIQGQNLYWSQGMNAAWRAAVLHDNYDAFLWFNDDGELSHNALNLLFRPFDSLPPNTIVTGAFRDTEGRPSYGGQNRDEQWLVPDGTIQQVWLMNGNLTLIPREVYEKVGFIDSVFRHGSGDYDYGIRARKAGCAVILTADYVGQCDRHDADRHPWLNPGLSLSRRLGLLTTPKYCPWPQTVLLYRVKGFYPAAHFFVETFLSALFPNFYKQKFSR